MSVERISVPDIHHFLVATRVTTQTYTQFLVSITGPEPGFQGGGAEERERGKRKGKRERDNTYTRVTTQAYIQFQVSKTGPDRGFSGSGIKEGERKRER